MEEPRLYKWYDRAAILPLLGDPRNVTSYCDGQWLIAPNVAVCLTKVVKTPPGFDYFGGGIALPLSHFGDAATLIWVADRPYRARQPATLLGKLLNKRGPDREERVFLPAEVDRCNPPQGGKKKPLATIHLFAQTEGTSEFIYLGRLEASHGGSVGARPGVNHGTAWFRMKRAVPNELWITLFGPEPGDLDHAALDRDLARLASPTTVQERLVILHHLVEYWHGPLRPEDGYSEQELTGKPMPVVLRWWYRWGGRRKEIMSGDNKLLDPEKLEYTGDGMLVFFKECQWCYELATHVEGDDPRVVARESERWPWEPEHNTLAQHLMLACLDAAVPKRCPFRASSVECVDEETVSELERHVPALPLQPWKWWGGMRFHAKNGAFMKVGEENIVWIGAKTASSLQFLKPFLNEEDWTDVAVS